MRDVNNINYNFTLVCPNTSFSFKGITFFHSLNKIQVLPAKQPPFTKLKYSVPFCTSLSGTRKAEFILSPHNAQHHLLAFHKPDKSFTNQPKIEAAIEFSEAVSKISWMNFNTSLFLEKVSTAKVSAANSNFPLPIKNSLQICIFLYEHNHTFTCHCWVIHFLSFLLEYLPLKKQSLDDPNRNAEIQEVKSYWKYLLN